MSLPTVSILGCGWLGEPLAKQLVHNSYPVKGSTTTPERLPLLKKDGIDAYLLTCRPKLTGEGIKDFFQAQVLVVTLPFRRDLEDPHYYLYQLQSVVKHAADSPVEFVVFTSSTSVYPKNTELAREDQSIVADNERSQVLLEAEQLFLSNRKFATTVIRFAGLYGGGRLVGRFLAGQDNLPDGNRPVNLIHRDDAVGIIGQVITQNFRGEILNACSDAHPTRKELYSKAAHVLGLPPPTFRDTPEDATRKIVSNEKLKQKLQYRFKFPDIQQILDLVE